MSRSKPSIARRRHETPVARMTRARAHALAAVEDDLARRRVDARDAARDQDLGAEPARLLQRAAARARRPRRRSESRGSSRCATTCRPVRRALRARPRACAVLRTAPYTAAASPAGPPPTISVSYSACCALRLQAEAHGEVAQRAAGASRCRRRGAATGHSRRRRHAPAHARGEIRRLGRAASRSTIWLRARKRRSVAAGRVPAMAEDRHLRLRRLPRCPAARRCARAPARRPSRRPPGADDGERVSTAAARPASRATARPRDSRRGTACRRRSAPRRRSCRATRQPSVRSTPSKSLTTSILPDEHGEQRALAAFVHGELAGARAGCRRTCREARELGRQMPNNGIPATILDGQAFAAPYGASTVARPSPVNRRRASSSSVGRDMLRDEDHDAVAKIAGIAGIGCGALNSASRRAARESRRPPCAPRPSCAAGASPSVRCIHCIHAA